MKPSQRNVFQRMSVRLAMSKSVAIVASRLLHRLDIPVYKLTHGKHSAASILTGLPIIVLTTTGAKTGKKRSVPLLALPDEETLILIATNWGQAQYPGWYYNLIAHPNVTASIQNKPEQAYTAHELEGPERERAWQLANTYYVGYSVYERRIAKTSGRHIPIFRLTPMVTSGDYASQAPQA